MRQHPLDREMRLAGIGRPEHGGDAGAGSPCRWQARAEMTKGPCFKGFLRRRRWSVGLPEDGDRGLEGERRARLKVFHNATRLCGRGLSSGTSPERIRARIADSCASSCFVHRNISRRSRVSGTRSSLTRADKRRFGGEILKVACGLELNQKRGRVNRDSTSLVIPGCDASIATPESRRYPSVDAPHRPPE